MNLSTDARRAAVSPPLPPKTEPWVNRLLAEPNRLERWVDELGSPLNLLSPALLPRNAEELSRPLRDRGMKFRLFFARKANRSEVFLDAAAEAGLGIDVGSMSELRSTKMRICPRDILVTALGKTPPLVDDALSSGALIVADCGDDLELITARAAALGRPARIGIRFTADPERDKTPYSRFGFSPEAADEILDTVLRAGGILVPEILHTHVDKYSAADRAAAARMLLRLNRRFRGAGVPISAIDLGGGIVVQYLEARESWRAFCDELRAASRAERPGFTHERDMFGIRPSGDGDPNLYPACEELSGPRFIDAILTSTGAEGEPIWREVNDAGLALFFEPGRALLDGCGATVSSVRFRKRDTDGNFLVGLGMNRSQLRPFRAEFIVDPFLVLRSGRNAAPRPLEEGAFLVGSSCSESDFIYRRKLALPQLPEIGDLFLFANTAGYLMHHSEIGTHGDPVAANLALDAETLEPIALERPFPELRERIRMGGT